MNDISQEQDEIVQLVCASRMGDKAAFERLVLLYQRQAVALALGVLGNRDDAAEVVQDAFIKAYAALRGLSQPDRFRFWLLKIVANEAVSHRRSARRRRIAMSLFIAAKARQQSDRAQEAAKDLGEVVERAMRRLTDKEARAIALFGLDGLPHAEVAQIMGCSAEAVRWHVHRARQKLRLLLKEHLE
jgi:RNA polymerase sigma-70 factor (ECF subfamily)